MVCCLFFWGGSPKNDTAILSTGEMDLSTPAVVKLGPLFDPFGWVGVF